jgi:hypothetical protein
VERRADLADGYSERLGELAATRSSLDGGVGMLSELAVARSAAQTESDAPMVVAVGDRWRRLLDALAEELVASPQDVGLVHVVPSPGGGRRTDRSATGTTGGSRRRLAEREHLRTRSTLIRCAVDVQIAYATSFVFQEQVGLLARPRHRTPSRDRPCTPRGQCGVTGPCDT